MEEEYRAFPRPFLLAASIVAGTDETTRPHLPIPRTQSNISNMNKKKPPYRDYVTANFSSAYVDKGTDEEEEDEIGATTVADKR
mmetsp:Transcript_9032/g.21006  ORF Transcript_9032/g.21006 Transcript_9032/m.21006 type:complete len:84 (-) Transcript_9032:261-512(-)